MDWSEIGIVGLMMSVVMALTEVIKSIAARVNGKTVQSFGESDRRIIVEGAVYQEQQLEILKDIRSLQQSLLTETQSQARGR